jgi:hypothetical protein
MDPETETKGNPEPPIDTATLDAEHSERTSLGKFKKAVWNRVEKLYENPVTNIVLEVMCELGAPGSTSDKKTTLMTCGEDVYLNTRPELLAKGYADELKEELKEESPEEPTDKKKKKKKEKKAKKQNKFGGAKGIILDNISNTFRKQLKESIETFLPHKLNTTFGFRSQYAEIRLVAFMYCAHYMITKKLPESDIYELIAGIIRTLSNIHTITNISKTACKDLEMWQQKLKQHVNFSYRRMFTSYPRLSLTTKYDTVFPTVNIKPYKSQVELMHHVKTNSVNGVLIPLKAAIAQGKTSVVLAVAKYVEALRADNKAHKRKINYQLLFTCSSEPVRQEVCRMLWNKGTPFGVAHIDEDDTVKIINNYNCENDFTRAAIVADLDATMQLLKEKKKDKETDYLLFFDEPTIEADEPDSSVTKAFAKIMLVAPKVTVLSSATLPDADEMPELIDLFKQRHPLAKVETVYSRESLIGCEVINFDGSTLTPHIGCQTKEQLATVIKHLTTKPFIGRMYTAPVVYRMRDCMESYGIPGLPDLEQYFSVAERLCQTTIQNLAVDLLSKLLSTDNEELILKVCESVDRKVATSEPKKETKEEPPTDGFSWEEEPTPEVKTEATHYNLDNMFTTEAYRYAGPCLVITDDPIKYALEKSKELLANAPQASRLIKQYFETVEAIKKELVKIEDASTKSKTFKAKTKSSNNSDNPREKKDKDKGEINTQYPTNQNKKAEAMTNLMEKKVAEVAYPKELRVNTYHHIAYFANHMLKTIDPSQVTPEMPLDKMSVMETNDVDWVKQLMFSNITLFAPYSKVITRAYKDSVLEMAADKTAAFITADKNISFGANYPLSHVVHDDDLKTTSINTLFQRFGRAGRPGTSYTAFVHIGPRIAAMVKNYIHGTVEDGTSVEAKNIAAAFIAIREEITTKKQKAEELKQEEERREKIHAEQKAKQELFEKMLKEKAGVKTIQEVKDKYNSNKNNDGKSWRRRHEKPEQKAESKEAKPEPVNNNNKYVPPPMRNRKKE